MRIIAGLYKSRKLKFPKCRSTRPITDRIKESLFGIMGEKIINSDVLDLFAGSGSIGIESLSRGAKSVTFVEINTAVLKILKENIDDLGLADSVSIIKGDVVKVIENLYKSNCRYSVIFIDSPYSYETGLIFKSFNKFNIATKDCILISRNYWRENMPEKIGELSLFRKEKYGDGMLYFYKQPGILGKQHL